MKVLNFGSLNIDYTYSVDHFVQPGETLAASTLETFCGGKGLNQSCALAKAGAQVWHAGKTGPEGSFLLMQLQSCGVNTQLIEVSQEERTGHAIIQKDLAGENCILLYGGANQSITREQIETVFANFTREDILVVQNEISELSFIIETAHCKGMKIFLTPAPMNDAVLRCPLDEVDTFLLNQQEAQSLLKSSLEGKELAAALSQAYPASQFVLTLGSQGSIYCFQNTWIQQPAYSVPVVDTTGAGDTFAGFYIAQYLRTRDPAEAMKLAAQAAAISITQPGASSSIPALAQVKNYPFH